jgi:hypothetical protein
MPENQLTLAEISQRLKDHDARFGGHEGRLERIERRLQDNTDTLTLIVQMLNQRFEGIDQRFVGIDQRFENLEQRFDDLKCFFELKWEEQRSDFRAFREMQRQAGRNQAHPGALRPAGVGLSLAQTLEGQRMGTI